MADQSTPSGYTRKVTSCACGCGRPIAGDRNYLNPADRQASVLKVVAGDATSPKPETDRLAAHQKLRPFYFEGNLQVPQEVPETRYFVSGELESERRQIQDLLEGQKTLENTAHLRAQDGRRRATELPHVHSIPCGGFASSVRGHRLGAARMRLSWAQRAAYHAPLSGGTA